jgi:hypothetical protein
MELEYINDCGVSSPRKITPDFDHVISFSLGLHKNCILYDLLRDVMEKIIPAGIPQHFWKQEQVIKFKSGLKSGQIVDKRKVLSLYNLEYGFVMWMVACGISTVVFFVEFLGPKFKKFVRASVGLFYFLKLLRIRLAHHHI